MTHAPVCRVAVVFFTDGDLSPEPEQLGVGYLVAALRVAGFEARSFGFAADEPDERIHELVRFGPGLVGLSLSSVSAPRARLLGRRLREALAPSVHLTAGGPLPTFLGIALLRAPGWEFLDSLLRGESESSLPELARAVGAGETLEQVRGLCRRDGRGGFVATALAAPAPLDRLTWPARDELAAGTSKFARVSTSRGCTSACTFCNAPHAGNRTGTAGRLWRGRRPEDVVDEIEHLVSAYGVSRIEFVDSTFEDPGGTAAAKERVGRIAALILDKRLPIRFGCCMQAQNWSEADADLVKLLASAGLDRVLIGVESASTRGLERWNKRATVRDNHRAVSLIRRHGIHAEIGAILFHPHVDEEESSATVDFLRDHGVFDLGRYAARLELYPGAVEVERLRAEGLLRSSFDETFDPFAYEFVSAEMKALAESMAAVAASRVGGVRRPHSSFREEYLRLHGAVTWRRARLADSGIEPTLLDPACDALARVEREVAAFCHETFHRVREAASAAAPDADRLGRLAGEVDARFAAWRMELARIRRVRAVFARGFVPGEEHR